MGLADTLRSGTKQPVILCNWQLGKELSKLPPRNSDAFSWTKAPVINGVTYSNTYYADIDTTILLVRRDVIDFTFAGVPFAAVGSAAIVDRMPGSWCWDAAINRFYMRPAVNETLDSQFWFDNGTGNYGDETEDAASVTTADITIHANLNDIEYFGAANSKFEYLKLVFSTIPVPGTGTRAWQYWNGAAWTALTVTPLGSANNNWSSGSTQEFIWAAPANWAQSSNVGNPTVGTPLRYWIRSIVQTANYTTAGVGTQFLSAPIPNENICVAWVELPIANIPIHINSKFYEPRLIADDQTTSSKLSSKNPDAFRQVMIGTTVNDSGGTISISNGDGAFDGIISDYQVIGGKLACLIGYNMPSFQMAFADYTPFRTAIVEGMSRKDNTLNLSLMNQTLKMDARLLQFHISSADYPTMDRSKDGIAAPLYFGNTETLSPSPDSPQAKWNRFLPGIKIKQGTTGAGGGFINQRWKFAAVLSNPETGAIHLFGSGDGVKIIGPSSVWHMKADRKVPTQPVAKGNYDVLEYGTVVSFKSNYEVADGDEIRIQTQGYRDDIAGTFTGTVSTQPPIGTPNDITHFILICLCGYKTAQLNIATFTQSGSTKQGFAGMLSIPTAYKDNSSVYISDANEIGRAVIHRLMMQFRGLCEPDNFGTLSLGVLSAVPANSDPVLFRHQSAEWEELWNSENIASRVLLKFRQMPSTGQYSVSIGSQITKTVSGINVIDKPATAFLNLERDVEIETYMYTQAKADALSKILYDYLKRGVIIYKLRDTAGIIMDRLLGDRMLFTRTRAIGGSVKEKKTWLLTVDRRYGSHTVGVEAVEAS